GRRRAPPRPRAPRCRRRPPGRARRRPRPWRPRAARRRPRRWPGPPRGPRRARAGRSIGRRRWVGLSAGRSLLVLVDDLGVDHLVIRRLAGTGAGAAAGRGALGGRGLVELLGEALAGGHQGVGGVADRLDVAARQRALEVAQLGLDGRLLLARDLVALLLEQLLGLVDERVGLVADLGLLAAPPVLLGVGLGVPDHPVDLLL